MVTMDSLMTILQLAPTVEDKLSAMSSIRSLLRSSGTNLSDLTSNSVKLFVIMGSLLESEEEEEDSDNKIALGKSVLKLITNSLPLLETDASMLFALITPR